MAENKSSDFGRWKKLPIGVGLGLSSVLLLSWIFPGTRSGWDALDEWVFRVLNSGLVESSGWTLFWAVTNWRPFDLLGGGLILGLLFYWARDSEVKVMSARLAEVAVHGILIVAITVLFQEVLGVLDYKRRSPTLIFEDVNLLSELVTWIEAKDTSKNSFPGDHAFVLMSWAIFLVIRGSRRLALFAVFLLAPFILPRLVGGAHWLTDVTVGSGILVGVLVALWYGTPFFNRPVAWLAGILEIGICWLEQKRDRYRSGSGTNGVEN